MRNTQPMASGGWSHESSIWIIPPIANSFCAARSAKFLFPALVEPSPSIRCDAPVWDYPVSAPAKPSQSEPVRSPYGSWTGWHETPAHLWNRSGEPFLASTGHDPFSVYRREDVSRTDVWVSLLLLVVVGVASWHLRDFEIATQLHLRGWVDPLSMATSRRGPFSNPERPFLRFTRGQPCRRGSACSRPVRGLAERPA
jgi:hypothetical protein